MRTLSCVLLSGVLAGVAGSPAAAQTPLPLGTVQQGTTTADEPARYSIVAKSAGVLVAAVRGEGDIALQVTDDDGQQLRDGSADRDLNGSEGTELLSVTIPEAGAYHLRVLVRGTSTSKFEINGSWLPFPSLAPGNLDPDRRPSLAKAIKAGAPVEDSLNADAGDTWDWFVMKPAQAGTLAIVTRRLGTDDIDLVLEVFVDGNFSEAAGRSDQDLQGDSANESATVIVKAGQTVHVKVSSAFSRANARYRLSSSVVP